MASSHDKTKARIAARPSKSYRNPDALERERYLREAEETQRRLKAEHLARLEARQTDEPQWPIYKFGGRWICDGPHGRLHALTKRALLEMLEDAASSTHA
jgi:hypothetical protein